MVTPTFYKKWQNGEVSDKDFGAILRAEGFGADWDAYMNCQIPTSELAWRVVQFPPK